MRAALFILGMTIGSGLQALAESNGYKTEPSDSLTLFFIIVFCVFCVMDIVELRKKVTKGEK